MTTGFSFEATTTTYIIEVDPVSGIVWEGGPLSRLEAVSVADGTSVASYGPTNLTSLDANSRAFDVNHANGSVWLVDSGNGIVNNLTSTGLTSLTLGVETYALIAAESADNSAWVVTANSIVDHISSVGTQLPSFNISTVEGSSHPLSIHVANTTVWVQGSPAAN